MDWPGRAVGGRALRRRASGRCRSCSSRSCCGGSRSGPPRSGSRRRRAMTPSELAALSSDWRLLAIDDGHRDRAAAGAGHARQRAVEGDAARPPPPPPLRRGPAAAGLAGELGLLGLDLARRAWRRARPRAAASPRAWSSRACDLRRRRRPAGHGRLVSSPRRSAAAARFSLARCEAASASWRSTSRSSSAAVSRSSRSASLVFWSSRRARFSAASPGSAVSRAARASSPGRVHEGLDGELADLAAQHARSRPVLAATAAVACGEGLLGLGGGPLGLGEQRLLAGDVGLERVEGGGDLGVGGLAGRRPVMATFAFLARTASRSAEGLPPLALGGADRRASRRARRPRGRRSP